jgi:hypothetical protein
MTSDSGDVETMLLEPDAQDEVESESGREYRNDRRRNSSSSSSRYSTSSDVYTFIVDDTSDRGHSIANAASIELLDLEA